MLAGVAVAAGSIDDRDLVRCARIAEAEARLECFEALAAQAQKKLAAEAAAAASRDPRAEPTSTTAPPAKTLDPSPANAGERDTQQDEFGFASRRVAVDESQPLRVRHVGEFRGWSGNTLFKLENGQLWQQTSPGRLFKVAQQPLITIERGALGSYWLSVEGANSRVRVTRIE